MKKKVMWCVAAFVLAMSVNSSAGWMEERADFWAESAAKEFNLTPEQTQAVREAALKNSMGWKAAAALKEAGDMQGFEEKQKAAGQEYLDAMMNATGAEKPKQIWEFNKRTQKAWQQKNQK